METAKTLGQYLKAVRDDRGFSSPEAVEEKLRQMGHRLRGRTIRAIEKDQVQRPEAETLELLALVYGLDYNALLVRAGYLADEKGAVNRLAKISPSLVAVLEGVSLEVQDRLAGALPGFLGLAQQVATGIPPTPAPEPPTPSGPPTEDQLRAARAERVMGLLTRLPDDEFEKAMQKMEEEFDPLLRRKGEPHFQVAIPKVIAS